MVVLCTFCATGVYSAQNAPTVMSKYGEIQSVNKYSSNPFWTADSPYNQRFPKPIYANGPDVNTGDCNRIVQNLVSQYCANRDNCSNSRISDIRPIVMVQLSQLPGHNFATSCGGYIDSVFEDYKKTYGNVSTNNIVQPTTRAQQTIQIENPFKQKKSDYEIGVDERTAELESMQRITTPAATVTLTDFPKTIDDLSFTDRLANTTAGYEPYKNLNAYKTPKFETEDEYYERMKSVLEHDIHYVGAGAANNGCPTKYLTGRGATVSCTPMRQNGTCTEWCTDAALTNCKTSFTISSNDRDDKTFYGKCTCNPGYEESGYKCVKPGTQDSNGPNTAPSNCPDPHMDANCQCTGKYAPDSKNKDVCICANGEDISNDCEIPPIPMCIQKMSADQGVIHYLQQKLKGITKIDADILEKQDLYSYLADKITLSCVTKSTPAELNDFNSYIDTYPDVFIPITLNGETTNVRINGEKLLDNTPNTYKPYGIIAISDKNTFSPQQTVTSSDIDNLVSIAESWFLRKNHSCVLFYGPRVGLFGVPGIPDIRPGGSFINCIHTNPWGTPDLSQVAQTIWGNHIYNLSAAGYLNGLLLRGTNSECTGTPVTTRNYIRARANLKKFVEGLKSMTDCQGLGMILYLIEYEEHPNNAFNDQGIIKSEKFTII